MPANADMPRLGARFSDAFALTHELHRAQVRKGTDIPYVSHLMAVAAIVIEHGGDEDEAIAALLHDAVEDCGGLPVAERIRAAFGDRVANLVLELSDSVADTRDDTTDKADWQTRKRTYLAHLATASPAALRISAADKLHNLRSIVADLRREGEALWARFNAGRDDQRWYYHELVKVLTGRAPAALVEALAESLQDLEAAIAPGDLAKAIAIAARVHITQRDKGGGAYILHPLRVMNAQATEPARIAGVLHDVVEDGIGWPPERLAREGFSIEVIEAVQHLTKVEGEDYDAFVDRAATNAIARAVKRADLEDNMDLRRLGAIREKDIKRLEKYHRNWRKLAAFSEGGM
jgi:(p)ppGpp synthase/HD superfamily hydrolase